MMKRIRKTTEPCKYVWGPGTRCPNPPVLGDFCQQHCPAAALEVYKVVSEHYRQDVREFWTRSNFYMLVQGGLLSVYFAVAGRDSGDGLEFRTALGISGLVIAFVWFVVATGSIEWVGRWRRQILTIEQGIDPKVSYWTVENVPMERCTIMRRLGNRFVVVIRAELVTQYLPLLFAAAWGALIVLALRSA